jgi:hypothetical protein
MSETVKYHPVLARIKLLLNDASSPLISFRATVISRKGDFVADYSLVHRLVTEYKGKTFSCEASNAIYVAHYRAEALMYLGEKIGKLSASQRDSLEPVKKIEIDLTNITPALVSK